MYFPCEVDLGNILMCIWKFKGKYSLENISCVHDAKLKEKAYNQKDNS